MLERGLRDPETNVTHDDVLLAGKIAWARLKEFPGYYIRWTDSKPKRISSRQRKGRGRS